MNLRAIDLNLLVVLQQLLRERHVSNAAEQLGMSQPAVSRALQRLRDVFDDELLVRTSQGYDLSARAVSLLPQLDQLLDDAKRLIIEPVFEPKNSTQTVRFYGPESEINWFLPPLFARMRQLAPRMGLETYSAPKDHFAMLEAGEVHFAFSTFLPNTHTAQLHRLQLADLDFALVMSADNPLATEELTLQEYIAANHGLISLTGRGANLLEVHLIERGLLAPGERLNVPLRLGSFSSVGRFCEYSDILFRLPKRFAQEVAKGRNLVVRDVFPGMKVSHVKVFLYWHERYHKDAMCIWVREQLKELMGGG